MTARRKHGRSKTPEYRSWNAMRGRCLNERHGSYHRYGGRGITICARWRDSFESFLEDMGERPSPRHELDRIDNDGPYSPENCRWSSHKANARNRSDNKLVLYRGRSRLLVELCDERGLRFDTINKRLRYGWSVEDALETPVRPYATPEETLARLRVKLDRLKGAG